jgi:transcriptional regulator with XRE-family HTH domain
MYWMRLVADLIDLGFTQTQIGALCGVGQATVGDLARGKTKDPSASFGDALRALHQKTLMQQAPASK